MAIGMGLVVVGVVEAVAVVGAVGAVSAEEVLVDLEVEGQVGERNRLRILSLLPIPHSCPQGHSRRGPDASVGNRPSNIQTAIGNSRNGLGWAGKDLTRGL